MGLHSSLLRFILLSFYFLKPKTTQTLKMPKGSGLTKPMKLSAELADIVGNKEASRAECIKQLWAYIKKNNLQDPENKQFFNPDKKMAKVFNFCLFLLNYCFRLHCSVRRVSKIRYQLYMYRQYGLWSFKSG